jgi:hypothetical protein
LNSKKVALITVEAIGAAAKRLAVDGYAVGILSPSGKGEALAEEHGGIGVTESNQKYPPRAHFITDCSG